MKILFISYSYWPSEFGGELLSAIERFESLAKRGHQITVLTSGKPDLPSRENVDDIEIIRSPAIHASRMGRLFRRIVFVLWLMLKLMTTKPDVVHYGSIPGFNRLSSALIGLIFAALLRIRRIRTVYVHSLVYSDEDTFGLLGPGGALMRRYLNSASVLVSVSPSLMASSEAAFPGKNCILPYGVHDDLFKPVDLDTREATREELGIAPEAVVFSFLGSLGYRKGFDLLATAFAELSKEYNNWNLLVIGPLTRAESQNINENEVAAVTQAVKGNPNAVFVGRVNDRQRLAALIGSSDVFVFPSRREGMGIAPMEAMAAEIPPIIARIPGITDQANLHEQTGLYVAVDSLDELKDAMIRVGTDAGLRQRFGVAARARIEEHFSWENFIDSWEKVYTGEISLS